MTQLREKLNRHRPTLLAALAAVLCLGIAVLVWLAEVRPNAAKSLSEKLCDSYPVVGAPLADGESIRQTFSTDSDLLALAFVFAIPGEQPQGELALTLEDADTGEVLASSTGEMGHILPGQYTGLGLDRPVTGAEGRRYRVTLTPHYTGGGALALCYSDGAVLWQEELTQGDETIDGTLGLLVTTRRIGGFLTRFFLLVSLAVSGLVFFGLRAALAGRWALHRLVFSLVLGFGLVYSLVLPPYAAPDEKYHINQSFTLACQWASRLSPDEWRMGKVPLTTSYRREHDFNALLQNERTTVFTWEETVDNLFTLTPDSFDSHVELEELQTDSNPLLYLASAAAVFTGFVLHLGFVPTLLLGRLANLLLFAALAALAVKAAPFGKRVFAAAALLPMTLHLAASFSRDAVLLGLCFAFAALALDAVCGAGQGQPLSRRRLAALLSIGALLAPGKAVYLPLAALVLAVPAVRLGRRPGVKKALYLAACLVLTLAINGAMLRQALTAPAAAEATEVTTEATPRTGRGQPVYQNTDYEATLTDNTAENYVRRLYFYCEGVTEVSRSELDYWCDALRAGEVSAASLAQSFLFSEAQVNGAFTDDEFLSAATLAMWGYDATEDANAAAYLRGYLYATPGVSDRVMAFKMIYCDGRFVDRCAQMGVEAGYERAGRYPLVRSELAAELEALHATQASQSVAAEEDLICYTPAYILTHLPNTLLLVVRSAVQNGDTYLRALVGGSLSYSSLDLAWGWVMALYLLLLFAALPAAGEEPGPTGRARLWFAAAALGCCALAVAGCIVWTPVRHTVIYGLQGRYFLPVLPVLLLTCLPRPAAVRRPAQADALVMGGLCLVNAGILINVMLAVIAR
ncbi:MAG: DUF2142 domain-containing protein [Gemmiger sp.]